MNPTIKDVAKKADVSVATVSRVINNLPGYTGETEQKVLKAIDDLGYSPNELARGLVGKKIDTIGVLIPNLSSMVANEILSGIEDAAHKKNYSIIICNTDNNGIRTMEYLNILRNKRVSGVIVVSEKITEKYLNAIKNMRMSVVLVSTFYHENTTYVKVNDQNAAFDATEYLIKKGHKNITMFAGTKNDKVAGIPRINGYLEALKTYGIPINNKNIYYGDFSFLSGKMCMEKLLKQSKNISAIFCASDEMAVGALSVAYEKNIKIPDDISIIGYDNTQLASMSNPPLTSVSQFFHEMGYQGLNTLVSKINGNKVKNIIIKHKIIERKTVKKIN